MARLDPHTAPLLFRGWTGEWVTFLEELLVAAGNDPGPPDGSFDERTEAAVSAFQTTHRCSEDGAVGPETWTALQPFADAHPTGAPEQPAPAGSTTGVGGGGAGPAGGEAHSVLSTNPQCDGAGLTHHVTVTNTTAGMIRVAGVHLMVGDAQGAVQQFSDTTTRDVEPGNSTVYSISVPMGPSTGQPYLVNANAHAEWIDEAGAAHTGSQALLTYTVDAAGVVGGSTIAAATGEAKGSVSVDGDCIRGSLNHYIDLQNDTDVTITSTVAHLTITGGGIGEDFGTAESRILLPGENATFVIDLPMGPAPEGTDPYGVTATGWVDFTLPDGTPQQSTRGSRSYTVDNAGTVT